MPELKSFLKDYEAQEYKGVEVEFVKGKKAIMTIYDDGEEVESITLSDYSTKEAMHRLMEEKGFVKKEPAEIEDMKARLRAQALEDQNGKDGKRAERFKEAEERRRQIEMNSPLADDESHLQAAELNRIAMEKQAKRRQELMAKEESNKRAIKSGAETEETQNSVEIGNNIPNDSILAANEMNRIAMERVNQQRQNAKKQNVNQIAMEEQARAYGTNSVDPSSMNRNYAKEQQRKATVAKKEQTEEVNKRAMEVPGQIDHSVELDANELNRMAMELQKQRREEAAAKRIQSDEL